METSLPIPVKDWILLNQAIEAASSLDNPAVATINFDESPDHWVVRSSDGSVISVLHSNPEPFTHPELSGQVTLMAGPIAFIAHLAANNAVDDEACLVMDGNYVRIETVSGSSIVSDLAPPEPLPGSEPVSYGRLNGGGEVKARDLAAALRSAFTKVGVQEERVLFPVVKIGVEKNALALTVDWSPLGAPQMTYRVEAESVASDHRAGIFCGTIGDLLSTASNDATVMVEMLDDFVRFTLFEGEALWTVSVPSYSDGARRWWSKVERAFSEAGHHAGFASEGEFTTCGPGGDADAVTVTLHDTKPETIRLTLRVGDNFEETPEFYQQLSRLNSGKSGIKFWSEEGTLVACEDVPCYRFDDAPAAAEHLQREMVDLGVVLAAGSTLF
ncbi:MAG TPA: hypothetical protein EYQ49_08525 [Acidimicrobiia bacterium]|jgi:hypothetical protein|nr:hypothetical protein [Acidimicrobiia bacterium]